VVLPREYRANAYQQYSVVTRPGYKPGLQTKILHLHIKDHVTMYKLIVLRRLRAILEDIESYTHILHFLFDSIAPKSNISAAVNLQWAFDNSGQVGQTDPMGQCHQQLI
jgi:hypothetical protein